MRCARLADQGEKPGMRCRRRDGLDAASPDLFSALGPSCRSRRAGLASALHFVDPRQAHIGWAMAGKADASAAWNETKADGRGRVTAPGAVPGAARGARECPRPPRSMGRGPGPQLHGERRRPGGGSRRHDRCSLHPPGPHRAGRMGATLQLRGRRSGSPGPGASFRDLRAAAQRLVDVEAQEPQGHGYLAPGQAVGAPPQRPLGVEHGQAVGGAEAPRARSFASGLGGAGPAEPGSVESGSAGRGSSESGRRPQRSIRSRRTSSTYCRARATGMPVARRQRMNSTHATSSSE